MEQFGQSLRDLSPFFEKEAGDAYTVSCMLDSVIQGIERTADLQGSNDLPMSLLPMFEEVQKTINTENKKYYAAINKLYRAIERKFPMTPENLFDPSLFATDECLHAIDASIMDHLLRNGKYDLAEMFKSESGALLLESRAQLFSTLQSLLQAVSENNITVLSSWATEHSEGLFSRHSPLEFWLYRGQFLRISMGTLSSCRPMNWTAPSTCSTNIQMASAYGRHMFKKFASIYMDQIQQLLTLLLFLPSFEVNEHGIPLHTAPSEEAMLVNAPQKYHTLISTIYDEETQFREQLLKDFCAIATIPQLSPLQVSVDLGANIALSRIMKVRSLMKQRGNEWNQANELPVEIPLPPHLHFHSTFLCPVSKEPATEANPPMCMPCGHVICQDSLTALAKGRPKVKCPYCPAESQLAQAVRVYF